jgi:THO complex subunit 2
LSWFLSAWPSSKHSKRFPLEQPGGNFIYDEEVICISKEQYEKLYNKWHAKLGSVFLGSLKSTEYMVARACLLVLTRIVDAFPTRPGLGQRLLDALTPFDEDSYPLQDIKTAAQAYRMLLLKARDDGVWKEEDAAAAEERAAKEKAALKERQQKAEDRFEEMKLENEKISEEIGDGFRDRDDRRRGPRARGSAQPPRGRDDKQVSCLKRHFDSSHYNCFISNILSYSTPVTASFEFSWCSYF